MENKMEYILSQEEMDEVNKLKTRVKTLPTLEKLQEICSKAANEWPIKYWGRKEAEPWGCILTAEYEHYCDECPVQDICPYPHKEWSK